MSATAYQTTEPIHSPTRNRISVEDRAFHDWYRFVLSFPPHLVRHYLDVFDPPSGTAVLDPFCGINGMIAAARLGVDGVGIDLDPTYCQMAQRLICR